MFEAIGGTIDKEYEVNSNFVSAPCRGTRGRKEGVAMYLDGVREGNWSCLKALFLEGIGNRRIGGRFCVWNSIIDRMKRFSTEQAMKGE